MPGQGGGKVLSLLGVKLPCKLLRGRRECLVPPRLQSRVRAEPQHALGECLLLCRGVAVVAGNVSHLGPGGEAVLLSPACSVVVDVYFLTCRKTKAGGGVQGYLLQGASLLLSQSETCSCIRQLLRPCGT